MYRLTMAPLLGLYIRRPFSYKGDVVSRKRVRVQFLKQWGLVMEPSFFGLDSEWRDVLQFMWLDWIDVHSLLYSFIWIKFEKQIVLTVLSLMNLPPSICCALKYLGHNKNVTMSFINNILFLRCIINFVNWWGECSTKFEELCSKDIF